MCDWQLQSIRFWGCDRDRDADTGIFKRIFFTDAG